MKFTTLVALVGVASAIRIMDGPELTAEEKAAAAKKLTDPKAEEDPKAAKKLAQGGPELTAEEKAAAAKKLTDPEEEAPRPRNLLKVAQNSPLKRKPPLPRNS